MYTISINSIKCREKQSVSKRAMARIIEAVGLHLHTYCFLSVFFIEISSEESNQGGVSDN